ncbi:T9SS type A sorting domain-containing protein [candidate division KSB1 bacterium]|nr:T9SS type A sorting domain-containing protein [candidate division KSB1 bacterium]
MKTISIFIVVFAFCMLTGITQNLSAQEVPEQDSLALVALYNSTNGANWTNNTGWLTGPVSSWYGISITEGRVSKINLHNNNLEGPIPPEIGNLTQLKDLNLPVNKLSGSIPAEIGNLTNLSDLALRQNELSGPIPVGIGNLTNLVSLYLNVNQLTDSIPAQIGNLTKLAGISFYDNQLSGSIPSEMQNLTLLTELNLSKNQLTGVFPSWIGNLTELTSLSMGQNQFSDHIPAEIGNLTNLTYLYLASNQLSGPIPKEIGNLTNLNKLYLNVNQLSESIPPEIGHLSKLTVLHLDRNNLTGPIPNELYNLTNLTALRLYDNQLSDSLSSGIGNLTNLTQLWLNDNQFTGAIPAVLGNIINLQLLYLMNNQFSGAIPAEIANLFQLQNLNVNNNLLTDLPDLSPDTSLTGLQIQNNKFTFEDIEPNLGVENFIYSPQDSVGEKQDTTIDLGSNVQFSVTVGGTANQYQWMKYGVDISDAVNSSYVIDSAESSDQGSYVCKITNTLAAELILYSRPIKVIVSGGIGIEDKSTSIPKEFVLFQNYPNPFNPATIIKYNLPKAVHVRLVVYDLSGRRIKTLVDANQQPGHFITVWQGRDDNNLPVAAGVYFCRFDVQDFQKVIKLVLIK